MVVKVVSQLSAAHLPSDLRAFRQEAAFLELSARTPVLHEVESDFPAPPRAPATLRVGAWNLERCKHLDEAATLIRSLDLDVVLLSEMDDGMARSGNRNTTRVLARSLGMTYAFGVEFIETGHGTDNERSQFAGQKNDRAFHGNAMISRFALSRLDLLRLPGGEVWTDMDWHDDRLGSRIALGGVIETAKGPLALISLHAESLPGPAERAGHMRQVMQWIDASFPAMPVFLGGDINSADLPEAHEEDATQPDWFFHPDEAEPMFAELAAAGFAWREANTAQHTRRQLATGRPFRPFKKVDWLFARGAAAGQPAVVAAVDAHEEPVSDHEIVVAEITLS